MSQIIKKVSYIIGYRESNEERRDALLFVLSFLRKNFPELEILIIEQDSESKIKFDKSLNINHIFIQNSGLYNRCWAFNVGVRHTKKNIFAFADSDIFLEKEDYVKCFEALENFEAVTPNKTEALNIKIADKRTHKVQLLNKRALHTFAGGMLILTRKAYEKTGGWDERFEGWGGEDDALSHLIFNRLTTKTFRVPFFHIDHPKPNVDWKNQHQLSLNKHLKCEIVTLNGAALDRYIHRLRKSDLGNEYKCETSKSNSPSQWWTAPNPLIPKGEFPPSTMKHQTGWDSSLGRMGESEPSINSVQPRFVLAITTFNRLDYLKNCVESFLNTRSSSYSWQIIIADDGSTDGTKDYLKKLEKEHHAIIIHNERTHIHHQVNTILKMLSGMDFDFCFRCDDDVVFTQNGWDDLYWKTSQRTGYEHLIFYDKNWCTHKNLNAPIQHGHLISRSLPTQIQGAFYTLTKDIIKTVGYFDEQQFGPFGWGHIDYSFRCCRAGFNALSNPYDVVGSNDFIQLQGKKGYHGALSSKQKTKFNTDIELKKQLIAVNRIYIPYNENFASFAQNGAAVEQTEIVNTSFNTIYQKADATFYKGRGFMGFVGFVLKKIYNLSLDLKLYFIPNGLKSLGKTLNKVSIDLMNIEN